ncbi:MAG: hypothetical protein IPF99_06735 [Deltaproteobacteria bacterium]|nr:hypothetical protein [Deltaproteobacteria bacterium]
MKRPLVSLLLATALLGCDPLLGGRCSEGWIPSPGACDAGLARDATGPDASDDRPDASALDDVSDAGATDATLTDATLTDGALSDGAPTDSSLRDGATADTGCTPPQTLCGSVCVDTASSFSHCGGCGRACALGEVCASGVCSAVCRAPLLLCDGVCLDPQTDPENCGGCGVVCSTGICNGGRCRDARAGHLVLIGHDYQTTRPDQNRVVGNAVFLSAAAAPRVATYTVGALPASVTSVRDAVRQVAGLRAWRETEVTSPDALPPVFSIDSTDVVLIHHQPSATDAAISALAVRIAGPAVGFLRAGGVVVVLDGEGSSRGTWPLAGATGLLTVTGHRVVTGSAAEVVSGADAVAIGLPVAYRAERGSVTFLGTDGAGEVIRVGQSPLVLHRVVFGR